ncbi:hypothetical protein FB451DRAFT_1189050 [Mycena latifolia]|nr:hypothetical protein FB451DRAFT_1189050 [Mycena latifolia]
MSTTNPQISQAGQQGPPNSQGRQNTQNTQGGQIPTGSTTEFLGQGQSSQSSQTTTFSQISTPFSQTSTDSGHVSSPTAGPTEPQTGNALPAEAIAGIDIGIFALVSLTGLCVWRRRCRQHVLTRRTLAASPFILLPSDVAPPTPPLPSGPENSGARSISASTVRQQFLQNELRAAQEKRVDLEDLEQRTWSTNATEASVPSRIMRMLSTRSASTMRTVLGLSDLVAQLRERNEARAARIRELEHR